MEENLEPHSQTTPALGSPSYIALNSKCGRMGHSSRKCKYPHLIYCGTCGKKNIRSADCCPAQTQDKDSGFDYILYSQNPLIHNNCRIIAQVTVDNKIFNATIDTAAMLSFVSDLFANELSTADNLVPIKMHVRLANGKRVRVHKSLLLDIRLGDKKCKQQLLVLPDADDSLLLGMDFLTKIRATITSGAVSFTIQESRSDIGITNEIEEGDYIPPGSKSLGETEVPEVSTLPTCSSSNANAMDLDIKTDIPDVAPSTCNNSSNAKEKRLIVETEIDENEIKLDGHDIEEFISTSTQQPHTSNIDPEMLPTSIKEIIKENSGHYGKRFRVFAKDNGIAYTIVYNRKGELHHVTTKAEISEAPIVPTRNDPEMLSAELGNITERSSEHYGKRPRLLDHVATKTAIPDAATKSFNNNDANDIGFAVKTELEEDDMQHDISVDDHDIEEIISVCGDERFSQVPSTTQNDRVDVDMFSPKLKKIIEENSGHYGKQFRVFAEDDGILYTISYNRKGKLRHVARRNRTE